MTRFDFAVKKKTLKNAPGSLLEDQFKHEVKQSREIFRVTFENSELVTHTECVYDSIVD